MKLTKNRQISHPSTKTLEDKVGKGIKPIGKEVVTKG